MPECVKNRIDARLTCECNENSFEFICGSDEFVKSLQMWIPCEIWHKKFGIFTTRSTIGHSDGVFLYLRYDFIISVVRYLSESACYYHLPIPYYPLHSNLEFEQNIVRS